jgi:hypothetical protein
LKRLEGNTIEAATGDRETAVKLLALIRRHPLSSQTRTFSVMLGEKAVCFAALAEGQLAKLENQVPADAFAQALQAGYAMDIDTIVKDLLEN